MGFGHTGILGPPRRGRAVRTTPRLTGLRLAPFGRIVGDGLSYVSILVPEDTPPRIRPEPHDELGHSLPEKLVTHAPGITTHAERTLISDARDLLVETLWTCSRVVDAEGRLQVPNITPVEMFWDNAPAPHAVTGGIPVDVGSWFIHLGRNGITEQLLAELANSGQYDPQARWDGDLDALDADGFVALTLQEGNTHHLILAGGSDYGTYFAVAWFLHEHARARWCFPGPKGTVVPATGSLVVDVINYVDEPDYRGRSFGAMADYVVHTATEFNDMRNWLLRNRLRPTNERGNIFYLRNPPPTDDERDFEGDVNRAEPSQEATVIRACKSLPDHRSALLRAEDRVPGYHNLSRFFSPHRDCVDSSMPGIGPFQHLRSRLAIVPDIYPDPRGALSAENILMMERPADRDRVAPQVGTTQIRCVPDPARCSCPVEIPTPGPDPTYLNAMLLFATTVARVPCLTG